MKLAGLGHQEPGPSPAAVWRPSAVSSSLQFLFGGSSSEEEKKKDSEAAEKDSEEEKESKSDEVEEVKPEALEGFTFGRLGAVWGRIRPRSRRRRRGRRL